MCGGLYVNDTCRIIEYLKCRQLLCDVVSYTVHTKTRILGIMRAITV